jgi:hypothetical protein
VGSDTEYSVSSNVARLLMWRARMRRTGWLSGKGVDSKYEDLTTLEVVVGSIIFNLRHQGVVAATTARQQATIEIAIRNIINLVTTVS